jgi:hypothetical protein
VAARTNEIFGCMCGFDVFHIIRGGVNLPQTEFERRLVDFYFNENEQTTYLTEELTADKKLSEAYERRGREIAYQK